MKNICRRSFISTTSLLAVSAKSLVSAQDKPPSAAAAKKVYPKSTPGKNQLRWLEGQQAHAGTAFGVAWPKGQHQANATFALKTPDGKKVPMQTWTTAVWPDGSLKWTGHALAPDAPAADYYEIAAGANAQHSQPVSVKTSASATIVDTGAVVCELPHSGAALISSVSRQGKPILVNGLLTGSRQDSPERGARIESFSSEIESVQVEQSGPVRAVVKITGTHRTEGQRDWLPFSVRLYFHAGSECIRMVHTFVFDGDEQKDFISSLGVRFNVPMRDAFYDRHVRFAGQEDGIWGEAVQGLTGLRRNSGKEVSDAQIAGQQVPDITTWPTSVSSRIHWVPTWGDFSLTQPNANGFSLRKRTKQGQGWIPADQGERANGFGYVGGVTGGVSFGMRDFWKLHPTQLDIRDAATDQAEVTLWMWSPDSPPMDIRFYHDGLGQDLEGPVPGTDVPGVRTSVPDTPYAKQLDALNITYEDYEPGFGTPHGVARSTDIYLWAHGATPSRQRLAELAQFSARPPQLVPSPEDLHRAQVFSIMWDLPNRSTLALSKIEDRLDWSIDFYHDQVEQRHWYGFWDYGDVMHTYDRDRHVWRYDVGGYAWDNSELSTDMWLWFSFMRTGDTKAFRLAEAMNRHNRDVDIYHLGRFKGLGTRHNVQHWGCSAKQLRISTAMNRRFHYFLTTDERTGDVLNEVIEADKALGVLNPRRKLPGEPFTPDQSIMSPGTDYGATASNWLTAWERSGDPKYRRWLEDSMRAIGNSKWGFFTTAFNYDPDSKEMTPIDETPSKVSHLSIMFGLPTVCAELIQNFDIPEFEEAWLQYCTLCNAPDEQVKAALGTTFRGPGFESSHSRIAAYASYVKDDPELATRAVDAFYQNEWGSRVELETLRIDGPDVLNPVDEAAWVSTNDSAQWGLAAIQVSALIPLALNKR